MQREQLRRKNARCVQATSSFWRLLNSIIGAILITVNSMLYNLIYEGFVCILVWTRQFVWYVCSENLYFINCLKVLEQNNVYKCIEGPIRKRVYTLFLTLKNDCVLTYTKFQLNSIW